MARLLFVVNDPAFFVSHRLPIALEACRRGWEVHLAGTGEAPHEIVEAGMTFHTLNLSRSGMNPFAELGAIGRLTRLFWELKPDLVHLITIKPYLYGGIAARIARVPAVVSAVAGLGMVFIGRHMKARLLRGGLYPLFRMALGHSRQRVIFQNSEDRAVLERWGVMSAQKGALIRGSGVDLGRYTAKPEAAGTPVVAFAARLLRDKGVVDLVDAARILKKREVGARFWVIGDPDPGNPATVTEQELEAWRAEGTLEWLGYRTDIPELYGQAHVVCLPSYYGEGLPKALVEAAACGRAVVTTDHPGCRDAIESGRSGLLVPVRAPVELADALQRLIENPEERRAMGRAGRELAEREFAIEKIVEAHMAIYDELLQEVQR